MMKQVLRDDDVKSNALKRAWRASRYRQPYAHIGQMTEAMQISMVESTAANCGLQSVRLCSRWSQMVFDLQSFGKVSVTTRNNGASHRQTGYFQNIRYTEDKAIVHGCDLELGFNFAHWFSAFAIEETTETAKNHSLLFFDDKGYSIHEINMTEQSCLAAYRAFIRKYQAPDNFDEPLLKSSQVSTPKDNVAVTEAELQQDWRACQKVQDFSSLLNKYGLTRYQALQLAESRFAVAINPNVFVAFVQTLADIDLPVMTYICNHGVVQIYNGSLGSFKVNGTELSLKNYSTELYFDLRRLDSLWIVKRPIGSHLLTSLELYDSQKKPIALIYGSHDAKAKEDNKWRELTDSLAFSHQQPSQGP